MPTQRSRVGALVRRRRRTDRLPVQFVVVPAVFELLADPPADLKSQVRRDGHVAGVKQAMDVSTKQEAVAGLMGAPVSVRPDMGRLEGRQGPLLGDGAFAVVEVRDEDPEGPLAEAGADELGRTVPRSRFGQSQRS